MNDISCNREGLGRVVNGKEVVSQENEYGTANTGSEGISGMLFQVPRKILVSSSNCGINHAFLIEQAFLVVTTDRK